MKTVYIAADDTCFIDAKECRNYERAMMKTVKIPLPLAKEALRQCTPYMVTAKERRELAAKLSAYIK